MELKQDLKGRQVWDRQKTGEHSRWSEQLGQVSARIQVGPSKVNPVTFARAMREKELSFPECFHAGERELSAENAG